MVIRWNSAAEAVFGGERLTNVPVERQAADGSTVSLRLSAVPTEDDDGDVTGVCILAVRAGEDP